MGFNQFISTSTRHWCLGYYVTWLREVSCPPLAEQQMKTQFCLPMPPDMGKPLLLQCGIFTTALSEVLAASEGWVSGLAASICASRSLVSWFGDWKTRAFAARTEWGPHSGNFSLWGDAACVLTSWIHDPLKISSHWKWKTTGWSREVGPVHFKSNELFEDSKELRYQCFSNPVPCPFIS